MLCEHLPEFMRDFKEISRITETEDNEFALINSAVEKCLNNSFLAFADNSESGLVRWEKLFGIPHKSGRPAEEIRREISSILLSDCVPYTHNAFNAMLRSLYLMDGIARHYLSLDYLNYTLLIYLHISLENCLDEVDRVVKRWIPANLKVVFVIVYKRHRDLRNSTQGQLATQTHLQIKKEGLNRILL